VAAWVRAHYAEELSLPVLARLVYMSGPYLSRIVHEEMKVSLKHFIGSVRMANARELLRDPGLKVGEIGRRIGYAKSRGFLKFFKEQVGMTPLEYRSSLGRGSSEPPPGRLSEPADGSPIRPPVTPPR
jgi:two-component system response regulator YesN